MEHFFSFPIPRMSIEMIQMECPEPNPDQPSIEYSPLNPNAMEFVPSNRQRLDESNAKTKAESTSTTTLARQQIVGDAADQVENGYLLKRQIFECLSQLGDEQMPLEEVGVALLPDGQGISMRFTTKQKPGQPLQPPDPNEPIFHKGDSLHLDVSNSQKLASRPESVLVAQFLFRINDLLREKYEDGGDVSICPKCSNRSYTELEIEHQIEGIKAFENFPFTESTSYQDLVSHKAFKELCRKLGLVMNRASSSGLSSDVMPPPPQPSSANISIGQTTKQMETDVDAYAGDDESQSNGDELTPKGSSNLENSTEYVRGKLYRYENSEGSQLVNQLSEGGPQCSFESMTDDVCHDKAHPTTPAKSSTATSMTTTFPRLYKSAKAMCSVRGAVANSLGQSGSQARRATPYSRPVVAQTHHSSVSTVQKSRLASGGGQFLAGSAVTAARKLQAETCLPAQTRKQNHQRASTAPKTALGCQPSGTVTSGTAGRLPRQAKPPIAIPNTHPNHLCKAAAKGPNPNQAHGIAQRMIPRSTTTSLMRQSEVKRRMSLLRGESDSDMLFNEYLFK